MADDIKRNVTTVFRVDVSQFKRNITEANASMRLAKAGFEATTASMDDWSKTSEGLEAKIKQLAEETDANNKIMNTYREQLEATRKAKEQNVKKADELRKTLEDMKEAGEQNSAEFKDLAKQLAKFEKEIAKAEKAETDLTAKMLKADAAAQKSAKQMNKYGDDLNKLKANTEASAVAISDFADEFDAIDKSSKKAEKAIEDAADAAKLSKAQFEAAVAGMDKWDRSSEGLKAKLKQLSTTLETQERTLEAYAEQLELAHKAKELNIKKAAELSAALSKLENAGRKASKEFDDYSKELAQCKKAIQSAENAEEKLVKQMKLTETATAQTANEIDGFNRKLDTLDDVADDAGDGFTILKGALADLASQAVLKGLDLIAQAGHKIADGFKAAVTSANDLKSATNSFASQTGLDTTENPEYEVAIKAVYADNFGDDYADIANSMAIIKQTTGEVDASNLEDLTRNALMLRDAFDFDIQEQIRTVDMLMTQFGIDSATAFNLVAQGAQNGLNKNGDLLDTINEYSVHYKQLGYTTEEMFNSLVNGADAGTFSVDKLGDAMKEFGIRAKDGSTSTLEAYGALGLNGEQMTAQFAAGGDSAEKAMNTVVNKLLNMKDAVAQNTAGVALFGTMWEDLGVDGIKALTNMEGSISATADALQQINDVQYDDLGSAWEGLGRVVETNITLPIGQRALPIITDFVKEVSAGFKNADGDVETIAQSIGAAVGKMANGFTSQLPTLATAAQQFIPAMVEGIAPSIPLMVEAGADIFLALLEGVVVALPHMAPAISSIIVTMISSLLGFAPEILQAGITLLMAIISAIPQFIPTLVDSLPEIITAITEALIGAVPQLIAVAGELFGAILSAVPQLVVELAAEIPNIIAVIVRGLGSGVVQLFNAGGNLIDGLIDGMLGSVKRLGRAISNIGSYVVSGLKKFFGINSPSKLLKEKIGKYLPEGIAVGFEENAKVAIQTAKNFGKNLVRNIDVTGVEDKLAVIREGLTGGTLKVVGDANNGNSVTENTTNNTKSVTYAPTYHYNKPLNSKEIYRQGKNMLGKIVGVNA